MSDKIHNEGQRSLANKVGGPFLRSLGMIDITKNKKAKHKSKKGTLTVDIKNNKKLDEATPTIGHKSGQGADPDAWKKAVKKKKDVGWANQKDAAKKRRMSGGNIFRKDYQDRTDISKQFFKDDVDHVEETTQPTWPVYARILEARKAQTAGATAPEGLNDKTNPSGKQAIADLTKDAKIDDTEEKGHNDVVAAGRAGPTAKPRNGGDNIKSGDKKIVK